MTEDELLEALENSDVEEVLIEDDSKNELKKEDIEKLILDNNDNIIKNLPDYSDEINDLLKIRDDLKVIQENQKKEIEKLENLKEFTSKDNNSEIDENLHTLVYVLDFALGFIVGLTIIKSFFSMIKD